VIYGSKQGMQNKNANQKLTTKCKTSMPQNNDNHNKIKLIKIIFHLNIYEFSLPLSVITQVINVLNGI